MTLWRDHTVITNRSHYLTSAWQHGIGLMFKKTLDDEAYIFAFRRNKTDMVHMFFMRFPIDILWLDADKHVVGMYHDAKPYQKPIPFPQACRYMIEIPAGTIKTKAIEIGQRLTFDR